MKKTVLIIMALISHHLIYSQFFDTYHIITVDSCDFQDSCLDIHYDSNTIWQIGAPSKPVFNGAFVGDNSILTDTVNVYDTAVHSYFELRFANDGYSLNRVLSFNHKVDSDSLKDGGYIEVSLDEGSTWVNVIDVEGSILDYEQEALYESQDTLYNGENGFSGLDSNWTNVRFALIFAMPLKTIPDSIFFRFNFISDTIQNNRDGWMIDNIKYQYMDMGSSVTEVGDDDSNFKISPNPFVNMATITQEANEDYTFKLFNASGQLCLEHTNISQRNFSIERGNLPSGQYFYQISNKTKSLQNGVLIIK